MLVSPVDRRIDRDNPVQVASGVGLSEEPGVDPVPGAVSAEASVAFQDRLPRTERLWQVTPCHTGTEPVDLATQASFERRAVLDRHPAAGGSREVRSLNVLLVPRGTEPGRSREVYAAAAGFRPSRRQHTPSSCPAQDQFEICGP